MGSEFSVKKNESNDDETQANTLPTLLQTMRVKLFGVKEPEELPPNVKYVAPGMPIQAPRWPQNRGYKDVTSILSPKDKVRTDYINNLSEDATVLEIGFGDGIFLGSLKEARPDLKTIGVSVTSWKGNRVKIIDEVYLQYIPDDLTVLQDHAGQVDLIVDVFGAATYAQNPLHALIYSAMLLKQGGRFHGISALINNGEPGSAFGNADTQAEIVNFFQEEMGINLVFEVANVIPSRILSEIFSPEHLLVHFETTSDMSVYDYKQLLEAGNARIGIPVNTKEIRKMAFFDFGDFRVAAKEYIRE